MKKSLIIFGILFLLLIFVGVSVNAEDCIPETCSALVAECGNWNNGCGEKLECGECNNGACIIGKCYSFIELGDCLNFEKSQSSCLSHTEDCLTSQDPICEWENSWIYTQKLYWKGEGVSNSLGDLVVSVDENVIKNIDDIGIPLIMVLENSGFPEGTNLDFEIYKIPKGAGLRVRETNEGIEYLDAIALKVGNNAIKGVVNEEGTAIANWVISEEDLSKAKYNGRDYFFFTVKKDGKMVYSSSGKINQWRTVESIPIEEHRLALITKKGECSGTISCESFFKKWECEESIEEGGNCEWEDETSSCFGEGISCSIIGDGDTCREWKCSWKADSLWERFTDWLSILFKINQ